MWKARVSRKTLEEPLKGTYFHFKFIRPHENEDDVPNIDVETIILFGFEGKENHKSEVHIEELMDRLMPSNLYDFDSEEYSDEEEGDGDEDEDEAPEEEGKEGGEKGKDEKKGKVRMRPKVKIRKRKKGMPRRLRMKLRMVLRMK